MNNWKISPNNASLIPYIDCYWFLEVTAEDPIPGYPKLSPDAAGHLLMADPGQAYGYASEDLSRNGYGSHFLHPHRHTFSIDHSMPFWIVGVKFRVGALYSWPVFHIPPVLDRIVPVDLRRFFPSEDSHDFDRMTLQRHNPESCRSILDGLFEPCLSRAVEDKHSLLVRSVLELVPGTPLSSLGPILGCSQRRVERSFLRVTGFTLKQYCSIVRLDALFDSLYNRGKEKICSADIAAHCGFSDQPHLIRFLKDQIGDTPGRYSKKRNFVIDVYGNFE